MRAYSKIAVGAAVLTALTGCLDLDEEIVTGVTTSLFEDEAGLENAVNATFSTLRHFYGQERGMALSEAGTDLWRFGAGGPQYHNQYNSSLNPSQLWFEQIWDDLYRGINTANAVVSRAEQLDIPAERRDQWTAEVRYLRALFYFLLVQTFGDVHLTLEETAGVETETSRTPVAQVYEAIIADLEFAAERLPMTQPDWGAATWGAAQHLLAKVYLTRAEEGDMARAADLAEQVIDSRVYSLLPRFADVFDIENRENEEVIFPVRFSTSLTSNAPSSMLHTYFVPTYTNFAGLIRSIEYGRPFARSRPTDYLLGLYDREKDSRKDDDVWRTLWLANGESALPRDDAGNPLFEVGDTALWLPEEVEVSQEFIDSKPYAVVPRSQYNALTFPNLRKYEDVTRADPNDLNTQRDVIVSRLAETYLIAAEALLRDGRPGEALPYVNAVRRRAAKPGFEGEMEITAAQLDMDLVLEERARELAGEHKRWFDLVRLGLLVERVQAHNPEARDNIQPHHVLRPIPQTAIDRTTSAFPQNPGY